MTDPGLPEDELSTSIRLGLTDWLRSEPVGWSLIGLLAVVALTVSAFVVIGPSPPSPGAVSMPQQPAADPIDLTAAPDKLQAFSAVGARAWNAALPVSAAPRPPARPFVAPSADLQSYGRALDCLTAAVYYEAGSQSPEGQAAVAQVVLNRVRHPAYPRTVCGVVFQGSERTTGCQFTFTCDGSLSRSAAPAGWARSRAVASAALNGRVAASVGAATHYHADWVAPVWASRLVKVAQIQTHIFYRWTGAWGLPQALSGLYRGQEPAIGAMAAFSTGVIDPAPSPGRVIQALAPPPHEILAAPHEVQGPVLVVAAIANDPPKTALEPVAQFRPASVRRDLAVVADPLVNPGASPPASQQPRRRIPAPSSW